MAASRADSSAQTLIAPSTAAAVSSPERTALADIPTSHIAKMEVRVIEKVPAAA